MKWVKLQLARLFEVFITFVIVLMVYFQYIDDDPSPNEPTPLMLLAMLAAYLFVTGQYKKKLKRKMFQNPTQFKTPPPQPVVMPKPEPLPASPQKPAERRFAPVPTYEVVTPQLDPSQSALAPSMRRFIEEGEQAIQASPKR